MRIGLTRKMNKYINLKRIEFIITDNCTSKCSHCSIPVEKKNGVIDLNVAIQALETCHSKFSIDSIMTFGGEPMLYPKITNEIHKKAYELGIEKRQIITNGFWTRDKEKIDNYSKMLKENKVNNILVSVDSFHEDHLDFEIVKYTVKSLSNQKFESLKIHPCWYEAPNSDNKYDNKTRELIKEIENLNIETSKGNILLPDKGSVKNHPERFPKTIDFSSLKCTDIPYTNLPNNVESICLDTNGKIEMCNGDSYSISEFLRNYDPFKDEGIKKMILQGSNGLLEYANQYNVLQNKDGYYSLCEFCKDIRKKIEEKI